MRIAIIERCWTLHALLSLIRFNWARARACGHFVWPDERVSLSDTIFVSPNDYDEFSEIHIVLISMLIAPHHRPSLSLSIFLKNNINLEQSTSNEIKGFTARNAYNDDDKMLRTADGSWTIALICFSSRALENEERIREIETRNAYV